MNASLRRRRRRENNRIKLIAGLILAAIVLLYIINVAFGLGNVQGDVDVTGKGYIAITVHNEDTLWSIADEYMHRDYYDHDSFINEVVKINDIRNNQIYAGEQIMIPVISENNI